MRELPVLGDTSTAPSRLWHRAKLLTGDNYATGAVSALGREVGLEYLAGGSPRARSLLDELPASLFNPYVAPLRSRVPWSLEMWTEVMESVAVVETMTGCKHGCGMCYIDAPPMRRGGFMPWLHANEVFDEVAAERGRVLRRELVEVLVNDILKGRLREPLSILDAALALVRHSRNRFGNYSDHLICYWQSNPTDWSDPLFGRDYSDLCNAVARAFQLFDPQPFVALLETDPLSQARFQAEFGEDVARLFFATSMHAVTSTVPFAQGSIGERAVRKIIQATPRGSELVRVSIPHPNLMLSGQGNVSRYWAAVQNSLRVALPKLIYIFATSVDELAEVFECIAGTFERSELHWWIEARLGWFEIREGRRKSQSDEEILTRLRRVLKRLCFISNLEGRARQFQGNPLFSEKGTVMCVNGVVLAPDGHVHFQACTSPAGEDLSSGVIMRDVHSLSEGEIAGLIRKYPLANRARELVTPGISNIPLFERRKPWRWLQATVAANQKDSRYQEARVVAERLATRLLPTLRF